MIRRRAERFAGLLMRVWCLYCRRVIWPWQGRCGYYHTLCKHYLDGEGANVWAMPRWRCNWCGK